jgi:hypothetical protein
MGIALGPMVISVTKGRWDTEIAPKNDKIVKNYWHDYSLESS